MIPWTEPGGCYVAWNFTCANKSWVCLLTIVVLLGIIMQVLKKEFPNGIDLIYESVGGEMFTTCLNALARRGRLIVIGMISQVILCRTSLMTHNIVNLLLVNNLRLWYRGILVGDYIDMRVYNLKQAICIEVGGRVKLLFKLKKK